MKKPSSGMTDIIWKRRCILPWDVINHVDRIKDDPAARPESYWINTSGNELVKRFIDKAGKTTRNEIERLIAENSLKNTFVWI